MRRGTTSKTCPGVGLGSGSGDFLEGNRMSSNIPTVVPATMTSREIAELTGKTHAHVLRDIDSLLESLNPDLVSGFKSSTYADTTGKENRMFVMDRDSSYCLVAGY